MTGDIGNSYCWVCAPLLDLLASFAPWGTKIAESWMYIVDKEFLP